jgi:hypothetical protein
VSCARPLAIDLSTHDHLSSRTSAHLELIPPLPQVRLMVNAADRECKRILPKIYYGPAHGDTLGTTRASLRAKTALEALKPWTTKWEYGTALSRQVGGVSVCRHEV